MDESLVSLQAPYQPTQIASWEKRWAEELCLVHAFHAVDAVDPAQAGQDGFQLPLIANFQAGIHARVLFVGTAFQLADIGFRVADHCGDIGKQAGAIFGTNLQLHGESGFAPAAPLDGDAPFGLIQKILHVGAGARVHRDAAPTGHLIEKANCLRA